jgi:hypothetical protein
VVLSLGFLGILALGILWSAVAALLAEPEIGVVLFVGAICHGTATGLDLCMLRRRRRVLRRSVAVQVARTAYDGVAMFYSTRFNSLLRALLRASFAVVAGLSAGGILGWLASPHSPTPGTPSLTGAVGTMLLLVWVGWLFWVLVEIIGGRIGRGRLVIGPNGIYHRSHTFEHFVPWDAVVAVHAVQSRGGPLVMVSTVPSGKSYTRRTAWLGKQDEFKLLPYVVVRGDFLAVNPAVAYHGLRYYHAHPEARAELLTSVGEHRFRTGSILDQSGGEDTKHHSTSGT